jgi:hypothetical protein
VPHYTGSIRGALTNPKPKNMPKNSKTHPQNPKRPQKKTSTTTKTQRHPKTKPTEADRNHMRHPKTQANRSRTTKQNQKATEKQPTTRQGLLHVRGPTKLVFTTPSHPDRIQIMKNKVKNSISITCHSYKINIPLKISIR